MLRVARWQQHAPVKCVKKQQRFTVLLRSLTIVPEIPANIVQRASLQLGQLYLYMRGRLMHYTQAHHLSQLLDFFIHVCNRVHCSNGINALRVCTSVLSVFWRYETVKMSLLVCCYIVSEQSTGISTCKHHVHVCVHQLSRKLNAGPTCITLLVLCEIHVCTCTMYVQRLQRLFSLFCMQSCCFYPFTAVMSFVRIYTWSLQ